MRYLVFISILLCMIGFLGCGSSNLSEEVSETSGRLENIKREFDKDLSDMSARIDEVDRKLTSQVESIEDGIKSIKQALKNLSGGEIALSGITEDEGEYQELLQEFKGLKEEIKALKAQLKEVDNRVTTAGTTPDERRNAFNNMSDPEVLAQNLDKFIEDYGKKIEDSGQRAEFEADLDAYKMEATTDYTTEELLAKFKASIMQRMEETDDDRMKGWYDRQIKALDESSDSALETRITNFRRYENMRELSKIAEKYNISRSELRNYGLQVYGGAQ